MKKQTFSKFAVRFAWFVGEWSFIWFPILFYIYTLPHNTLVDLIPTFFAALIALGVGITSKLIHIEKKLSEGRSESIRTFEKWPLDEVSGLFEKSKKRIWIQTTWLPSFERYIGVLKEKENNLRIIVGDSEVIKQRENELPSDIGNRFSGNEGLAKKFSNRVRFSSFHPHMLVMIIDDEVYFAPMLYDKQAMGVPGMHIKAQVSFGEAIIENFEKLWEMSSTEAK